MASKPKRSVKPPFDLNAKFPTPFERRRYQLDNWIFNNLYPVPPAFFYASVAAIVAFHYRNPNNLILSLLPETGSPFINTLKAALTALAAAYAPVWLIRRFVKHFLFGYKGFLFENPKKLSLITKIWGVCMSVLKRCPAPRLHSCDGLLPTLPLPAIADTVARYLESVEPLHNKAKFDEIKQLADDFLANEGKKLQLYARLYWLTTDNYVSDFWRKYAYLYNRGNLLINSSVAHADLFQDEPANQALRAAHVVFIETLSALAMDRQKYSPLMGGMLSATHYDMMYAVTRNPGKTIDKLVNYGISRHVAIIHKGCFYKVDMFDENNAILSPEQLTEIFTDLLSRDETPSGGECRLAALTTDERAQWTRNRQRFFLENSCNAKSLDEIERALFVVNLDDQDYDYQPDRPELLDRFMCSMLTGDGANRWADKSLNYVVSRNAKCGGTTEHSIADGSEFDHIMENFVYIDTQFLGYPDGYKNGNIANGFVIHKTKKPKLAERLHFEVTDEMRSEVERCYNTYRPQLDDVDMAATIFRGFGKGLVKKGNLSPDGFVQMAIQLANFKDQGKFVLTYESASARFYANSRTETLRTVSKDSCAFVQSMLDTACSEERLRLLRIASESHVNRNRECMVGKGVDRHLFVLYVLAKGTNTSSPFLEHVLGQPWLLSTSQAPTLLNHTNEDEHVNWSWLGACFGAVARDGYGICYRFAGNHSICIHITSYKSAQNTDSHRFQQHLIDAFNEMAALFA